MDFKKNITRQLLLPLFIILLAFIGVSLLLWNALSTTFIADDTMFIASYVTIMAVLLYFVTHLIIRICFKPLGMLADIVIYAGHTARGGVAPNPESLKIGREMVTSLASQIYDLASMTSQSDTLSTDSALPSESAPQTLLQKTAIEYIGVPIIGIDVQQTITAMNKAAAEYIGVEQQSCLGKPLYDTLKLAFKTEETFELWLKDKQENTINSTRQWDRVRLLDGAGETVKQFDLVANFAKGNHSGSETFLALFDRTEQYSRDDQETSFVALAVHELRTPLTIMRGYIEVFEDEVGPTLTPELTGFMHKMQASAQQLTAFVGNILNVARVEENQLVLKLQSYNWADIVKLAVDDLSLRAGVHGIHIETKIDPNIPPVAVDRISIHEVINNLVDNAIKYSDKSNRIVLESKLNQSGMVETSVQDFGIGIPAAVMPDLFQKYYRSHKSRVQISGTGLGLYLSKAIVSAHGGNIWVRSKEGEGSVFSFTLQPFDSVKHEQAANEDGIMRGAHGWIKNHSLNRQ